MSLKSKPGSSETALAWVKSALQASFPNTTVRISRPAVVVEFAAGDETWEVIPGFYKEAIADQSVYEVPAAPSGWMTSSPQAHLNYVTGFNTKEKAKGGAKSLARLIKAWKYYCNVPVSSFYLEMRAAKYMADEDSFMAIWDLCRLLEALNSHQLAAMNDPSGVTGQFKACSSEARRIDALSKLNTASTRARKALDAFNAKDDVTAFSYLDLLFAGNFPAR